ncbi:lysM and putative peptidoglycan-binding domain-containing protein 2-like [Tachypleus tridentatus]|uniref:lysM and putative peptidoglycan-binding domain-containing protein 2-like n=1 Tax=Tachypleus tridentatus TaxID=6853 RepID=UPI003FCFA517
MAAHDDNFELFETETALLVSFVKNHTKYGSTSNYAIRREKCIKHIIQPTDTLQGLALRYGVTMEDIKRVNKLWTTDSLFLRPYVNIPVSVGTVGSSPTNSDTETPIASPSKESFNHFTMGTLMQSSSESFEHSANSEESATDFLVRIDSSIAKSKDKMKIIEKNIP